LVLGGGGVVKSKKFPVVFKNAREKQKKKNKEKRIFDKIV